MRSEQHHPIGGELAHQTRDASNPACIEVRIGLIEQNHARLLTEDASKCQALALTSRKSHHADRERVARRVRRERWPKLDANEGVPDAGVGRVLGDEPDRLADRRTLGNEGALREVSDGPAPCRDIEARQIDAPYENPP